MAGQCDFSKRAWGLRNFVGRGSSRNWVWEGKDWRTFASKEGISFEVRIGISAERILGAWEDFRKNLGIVKESKVQ